jgi:ankyrin repeat protein
MEEFYEACKWGDLESVYQLYTYKYPNLPCHNNLPCQNRREAILFACGNGHLDIVKYLFNISIQLHVYHNVMFRTACENGHLHVAKWLRKNVAIYIKDNEFLFHTCCKNGHLHIAKWLLYLNNDIDILSQNRSVFVETCSNGHLEVVEWLYTLDIGFQHKMILEMSFISAIKKNQLLVVKWLMATQVMFQGLNFQKYIYLFQEVCQNGDLLMAQWLLEQKEKQLGYQINYKDDKVKVQQIFEICCLRNRIQVVKWLVSICSEINISKYFLQICHNASIHDHVEIIEWLFDLYPVLLHTKYDILTAYFRLACCFNSVKVAELFQQKKPYLYVIEYDELDIKKKIKSGYIREREEKLWEKRMYTVWLMSSNSPNKNSLLYNLPKEIARYIVQQFC